MATLAQIDKFAVGRPVIYTKFMAARLQCAWDILAENSGNPPAARKTWSEKIMANYGADADREYNWFGSHQTVQGGNPENLTDAQILTATKSFIDAWAAYDAAQVTP